MDENGHIEFHLRLDELWSALESEQDTLPLLLKLSIAEIGVLTASLSLLRELIDDYLVTLALDKYGELGDPREASRRLALELMYEHFYTLYTGCVLGPPIQA